jgi:hypothetical protein
MRMNIFGRNQRFRVSLYSKWRTYPILFIILGACADILIAQNMNQGGLSERIQKLTDAIATTEAQLEQSQRQIVEMQKQLKALQQQIAEGTSNQTVPVSPGSTSSSTTQPVDTSSALQDIRDRQAMQEAQIATQEQTKVESASKYPVKITGLLLFNGFVNTQAVDMPATPTLAISGPGSTGAAVKQTVLGFDARGPHLLGASSYADLRVDFDGVPQSSLTPGTYSGTYSPSATLLRLRTAHAGLQWDHTEAYFSLDRSILNPDTPTSLTAVAFPALAWSGNLWTWNPQAGVTQEIPVSPSSSLQLQAALIDVGDALLSLPTTAGATPGVSPSGAEQSRWPGVEAHVAILGPKSNDGNGDHFGLGGYFAPHLTTMGRRIDAWAGTADARLLFPARMELTGSFYRGQSLGGLGAGAFKDFTYYQDPDTGNYYAHPLDDIGGWAQLKEKINQLVELNGAFGIDNAFAGELRRYSVAGGPLYQNFSRNRTYTGNVIFSPSAYLQLSLEYRHLESSPVLSPSTASNVIGLGAGLKF